MNRRRDAIEAWANAASGFAVSLAITLALRAAGWWDANALLIGCAYFAASVARSFALRRLFRLWEMRE